MSLRLKGLCHMLNNKGQSLILFVIVLPIILLILVFIIDIGKVISLKSELNNISKIVLDYGLDYLEEQNLVNILEEITKKNKNDIDNVEIEIIEEKIYIKLYERYEGLFSSLINIPIYNINVSYVGFIDDDIKRIENLGD